MSIGVSLKQAISISRTKTLLHPREREGRRGGGREGGRAYLSIHVCFEQTISVSRTKTLLHTRGREGGGEGGREGGREGAPVHSRMLRANDKCQQNEDVVAPLFGCDERTRS